MQGSERCLDQRRVNLLVKEGPLVRGTIFEIYAIFMFFTAKHRHFVCHVFFRNHYWLRRLHVRTDFFQEHMQTMIKA